MAVLCSCHTALWMEGRGEGGGRAGLHQPTAALFEVHFPGRRQSQYETRAGCDI